MQRGNAQVIIPLIVALLITVGVFFYFKTTGNSPTQSLPLPSQLLEFDSNKTYSVVLKDDPSDNKRTEVLLQDSDTKEQRKFISIENVYSDHYHPAEFKNGNLYIIRRFGETNDQLWKYGMDKNGVEVFSGKGIDFRVSEDSKFIAVSGGGKEDTVGEELTLLDQSGKVLKNFADSVSGNAIITPYDWIGGVFWVSYKEGPISSALGKLNPVDLSFKKFDLPKNEAFSDLVINPGRDVILYSNYPVFFDETTATKFKTSQTKVMLYMYDLTTKKKQLLDTFVAKPFNATWVDKDTVEYDSSTSSSKITKKVF